MNTSNKIKNMLRIRYELPLESFDTELAAYLYHPETEEKLKRSFSKLEPKIRPNLSSSLSKEELQDYFNDIFGFEPQPKQAGDDSDSLVWGFYKDDVIFTLQIEKVSSVDDGSSRYALSVGIPNGTELNNKAVRVVDGFFDIIIDRMKK